MKSIQDRANAWVVGEKVGMSSKAIWAHMMDAGKPRYGWSHPHDPDDLSRCLRLLDLIPEWQARMPEMAKRSTAWAGLIRHWDAILASFKAEFGEEPYRQGDGSTYELMKKAEGR